VKETFVVSIGGSSIISDKPDAKLIRNICDTISKLHSQGYNFALVVGGGKIAGDYVNAARELGANNFILDEIGIHVTRLNARLVIQSLEKAHHEVLTELKHSRDIIAQGKIPIFGGMIPGYTTDSVAALLAELLHATFINLSNVKGIFDSDPKSNPEAKMFSKMNYAELLSILSAFENKPRQNLILDVPCALILKRSKIKSLVLEAHNTVNLENAIKGKKFDGTTIEA
jgi:uridylate kinase